MKTITETRLDSTPALDVPQLISISPWTGEELGRVPVLEASEVGEAVQRARSAQVAWAKLTPRERADRLRKVRGALAERAGELADLTAREMGKHPTDALAGDVMFGLAHLDYAIRRVPQMLRPRRVRHSVLFATRYAEVVLEPRGVVGIISPYNYPVLLTASTLFMALAAGNAVVAKPSEQTPLTVLKLAEICNGAGLPECLFQVLTGDHTTGDALVQSGIDALVFVGGTATGRKIAAAAAARLLPVTLELGGSNAMLVLEDADLRMAARAAVWGGFFTSGQVCARVGRVLVARSVVERFTEEVIRASADVRHSTGQGDAYDVGPLAFAGGVAHVRMAVDEAVAEGACVLAGGLLKELPMNSYPPTVLGSVTPDMRVMREEVFGPVLCIYPVESATEAVALANASEYSLTASVWSKDRRRAWKLAKEIKAGCVIINDVVAPALAPESPWGGRGGASGYGRTGGPWGLSGLTHPKYISYDRLPARRYPWWFPYNRASHRSAEITIDLLYSSSFRRRLSALGSLLKELPDLIKLFR